jgi:flavin reductase (DIM6/NTAB) family NADH-FMN oxidoreductase RutF
VKVTVDLATAKPRLTEARDFGRFHLEVSGADESAESRLRLAALLESQAVGSLADGIAWVRLDWLRVAGPSTDAAWAHGLSQMLDHARRHGWVDDETGSVSAHIVWTDEDLSVSEARYRHVLGHFPTGVTVVSTLTDAGPVGFTCQSFSAVSVDPPLVLICPGRASTTWPRIRAAGTFAVNVLAADQGDLCRRFAANIPDRFESVGWRLGAATGSPLLDGVVGWLECRTMSEAAAGDHWVVTARVEAMDVSERDPLVFFRGSFHEAVPGR